MNIEILWLKIEKICKFKNCKNYTLEHRRHMTPNNAEICKSILVCSNIFFYKKRRIDSLLNISILL